MIDELRELIGKPYTPETARLMRYGGTINSKGIIVEVDTKDAMRRTARKCKLEKPKGLTLMNRLKSILK